MDPQGKTIVEFFRRAVRANAQVELLIDHPREDYQRQTGMCYEAHGEFVVIGPEGAPARVCIPYAAIRWFRRADDLV